MKHWGVVSLVLGLWVVARPAAADVTTRLIYVRTPHSASCPDQPALEKAVTARLGRDPFSIWGENTIIATVFASGGALRAKAELVDAQGLLRGSREVYGRSSECDELILALALAISITLDPMSLPPPLPAKSESQPVPEPEAAAAESAPKTVDSPAPLVVAGTDERGLVRGPADATALPIAYRAHGALFGGFAVLPSAVPGARFGLTLAKQGWLAGIEGSLLLPVSETQADGGEAVLSLWLANFYPCLSVARGFFACALGSFGQLAGEGRGIVNSNQETRWYAALGARVWAEFPLGRNWAAVAQGDLLGTLTRPAFQLNHAEVWKPPPLSGAVGLGLAVRFL
jgi:hypothetical protein